MQRRKLYSALRGISAVVVFFFAASGLCAAPNGEPSASNSLKSSEERILERPKNHVVHASLPTLLPVAPTHDLPALRLEAEARHPLELIKEDSGLAPCSFLKDVFWTLSDSGAGAYIFALKSNGEVLVAGLPKYRGVAVSSRRNIDWEAIENDKAGNLIIGDIGNNHSNRRNLCFYVVPEPSPFAEKTANSRKISFYYPTQDFFPDPSLNYDAEACFALNGFIYFFTKHWTNTETILWRVDPTTENYQAAVPVARFDAQGLVTDAAISPDGSQLAVLTYHAIWLFDLPKEKPLSRPAPALAGDLPMEQHFEEKFFTTGTPRFRKITSAPQDWQREGIAFLDEKNLLISAENGALFIVPTDEIK